MLVVGLIATTSIFVLWKFVKKKFAKLKKKFAKLKKKFAKLNRAMPYPK
jgi:hypothetical protein